MENELNEFSQAFSKLKTAEPQVHTDPPAPQVAPTNQTPEPPLSDPPPPVEPTLPSDPPVPSEKDLFSLLSDLDKNDPPSPDNNQNQPQKPQELTEDIQAKLKLADEYQMLLEQARNNNPIALAILAGENPEKLEQLARSLIPQDYSNLDYAQLVKMDFKAKGLEGDVLTEAVEETLEEFKNLPPWKQALKEKELKQAFKPNADKTEALKQYQKFYEDATKQVPQPSAEQLEQTKQQDISDISQVIESLDGAESYGVKFSKDKLGKQILENYNERDIQPYIKPDGKLDAQKYVMDSIGKNWMAIAKDAFEEGARQERLKSVFPNGIKRNDPAPTNLGESKNKVEQIAEYLNNPDNVNKKV